MAPWWSFTPSSHILSGNFGKTYSSFNPDLSSKAWSCRLNHLGIICIHASHSYLKGKQVQLGSLPLHQMAPLSLLVNGTIQMLKPFKGEASLAPSFPSLCHLPIPKANELDHVERPGYKTHFRSLPFTTCCHCLFLRQLQKPPYWSCVPYCYIPLIQKTMWSYNLIKI